MAEKISTLVLSVDLNCPKCCNKIRKVLCKLCCEVRSQFFDEKNNTVTISGPFDPEKLSKKLYCKAGCTIKDIKIKKEPEKPKPEPEKPKPKPEPEKPKPEPEKPKPKPEPEKPKPEPEKPKPDPPKPVPAPPPQKPEPCPVPGYPPIFGVCCGPCYEGYGWGPCHHGHGNPAHPPPSFDYSYGGQQCHCGCGGSKGCNYYIIEENPTLCTIM